jgi:thiamine transport system substrate-binding protein
MEIKMKILLSVFFALVTVSVACAKPTLTVYAPDYFTSEWGPGPKIKQEFEKICDCDLL